jgi:hypothetical protein
MVNFVFLHGAQRARLCVGRDFDALHFQFADRFINIQLLSF